MKVTKVHHLSPDKGKQRERNRIKHILVNAANRSGPFVKENLGENRNYNWVLAISSLLGSVLKGDYEIKSGDERKHTLYINPLTLVS
jgi:hypothetical protein